MVGSTGAFQSPRYHISSPGLHSSSGAPLMALPRTSATRSMPCQPCMLSPRRFLQGFTSAGRRKTRSLTIGPQSCAGNRLHRLATHYGRLHRGIPVPPLSHFFPGPPLIIGSTSDGPSSDFDDATDTLPTVYAVTEEIPSGVHIRPAQENEELNNWTSVLRYSAVIADV
ncbi:hypothetical protein CDL15_Pgr024842 [Punica granatum]|uniref:Uncharacterized protein n=1 Tax=Punica granatum TaxID=22663 RepID=A0A218XD84_PUNGR|nr:hypothetical protein CDL15_Pgr024842 [Punica granatum]